VIKIGENWDKGPGVISSRALKMEKVVGILGSIKESTWDKMEESIVSLKDFALAGGVSTLKQEIKQYLDDNIMRPLAPLINEFAPLIGKLYTALEPLIEKAMPVITWVVDVLAVVIQTIVDGIMFIINLLTAPKTVWDILPGLEEYTQNALNDIQQYVSSPGSPRLGGVYEEPFY
jgi:hypothetical protein